MSAVDRWLSGPASHLSAQAEITQMLWDAVPERALQIAAEMVGGVVVARVAWWVPWIADCLVQLATRAPKL